MSRGAPPTQPLSAVPQQVNTTLAQTGQMANQRAAIQQRGQIAREQMEMQKQIAADRNVLTAAQIQERARSQQEYRDLLMQQGEADRSIKREAMQQAQTLAEQDRQMKLAVMQQQQDLMKEERALKRAELEATLEEKAVIREQLMGVQAKQHDLALRMDEASAMQEDRVSALDDTRRKAADAMGQQIASSRVIAGRMTAELADGMAEFPDDMSFYGGTESTGILGYGSGIGGIDGRVAAKATALGIDTAGEEGFLFDAESYGIRGRINAQDAMEGRVADMIGQAFGGNDGAKAGTISNILKDTYRQARGLEGNEEALDQLRSQMYQRLETEAGVTDVLTFDTMLNNAAKSMADTAQAFREAGINRDFAGAERAGVKFEESVVVGGRAMRNDEAIIRRNLYDSQNLRGITVLGTSGTDLESLDALSKRMSGQGLAASELLRILDDPEFADELAVIGSTAGLRSGAEDLREVEEQLKDLSREKRRGEIDFPIDYNEAKIEAEERAAQIVLDLLDEQDANRVDRLEGLR